MSELRALATSMMILSNGKWVDFLGIPRDRDHLICLNAQNREIL
ncbi:MAG: hypothetical protein P8X75_14560 [Limibacillus sp.]